MALTDTQTTTDLRRRHKHTSSNGFLEAVKAIEEQIETALLLVWDDLPEWRRDNSFIHTGYRQTSNSYRRSFASLFSLHNESVNIWTHFLGSIVFSALGLTALYFFKTFIVPRYSTASTIDVLVFACFFAGAFICLGMSATFHALCNHSPEVARWGNKLDYTGIVFLIVGSYVPALYYGFYCLPDLMELYLIGVRVECLPWSSPQAILTMLTVLPTDLHPRTGLPGSLLDRPVPHTRLETLPGHDVRRARRLGRRTCHPWAGHLRLQGTRRAYGTPLGPTSGRPIHPGRVPLRRKYCCRHELLDQDADAGPGTMAREDVPQEVRHLGQLAPDLPRADSVRGCVAPVWHGPGI